MTRRVTASYEDIYRDYQSCQMTVQEIANKYNITTRTVYHIRNQFMKKNQDAIQTSTPKTTSIKAPSTAPRKREEALTEAERDMFVTLQKNGKIPNNSLNKKQRTPEQLKARQDMKDYMKQALSYI